MWIFTPFGFYSVVKKDPKSDVLNVRARAREDLIALEEFLGPVKIIELGFTDYRYRIEVKQETWAKVMAEVTMRLDYSNFKDTVKKRQGADRAGLYSRVWSVMYDLQPSRRGWSGDQSSFAFLRSYEDPEPAGYPENDPIEVICRDCGWYGLRSDLVKIRDRKIVIGSGCPECKDMDHLEYFDETPGELESEEKLPF